MITFDSRAGRPLAGVLTRQPGPAPAAIVCHGMLSSMRSLKHAAICGALGEAGYHTLRFDFTARGRSLELNPGWSPGRIVYGDQIEDLAGAVAFLHAQAEVTRLCLIGSSMGGTTSLLYAADTEVDAIITLASPAFPARPRPPLFGPEVFARWRAEGTIDLEGLAVESSFLDDAEGRDVIAAAVASPARKLFVHGTADKLIPPSDAEALAAADPNGQALLVEGAGHRFGGQHEHLLAVALEFLDA